jgi:triosephosphate isomerase
MSGVRPALIIGNWKMHRTVAESAALARDLAARLRPAAGRDVAIAPPFTALPAVATALAGSPIGLAAQDIFWESEGPYTGEISALMLQDLGVRHVIIGHSERRRHLGETDYMVNRKVVAALRSDLRPLVCVGEAEAERLAGAAAAVVREQVLRALEGVAAGEAARLAVAYEPIWAIGTGRAATPGDIVEMHAGIRVALRALLGPAGDTPRILYGGSVTPANIDPLMASAGVDGALVGGASLNAQDFARICDYR